MTNMELAILGLVAERPQYGYDLEQAIEQRGMRQWTEIGFSSIYYALNKLEASGWLVSEKQGGGERPARRVYRLTEQGRDMYRQAVLERLSSPRPHTADFDLALANLPALSPDEVRQALETYHTRLEGDIRRVADKRQSDNQSAFLPPHVEALFNHNLSIMQAEFNWLTEYLRQQKI